MEMVCNKIEWAAGNAARKACFFGKDLGTLLRMPFESRLHLTAEALDAEREIIVECGAVSVEQTMLLIQTAVAGGAAGICVASPPFFGIAERELVSFYQKIAQTVPDGFPLYLRHIPQLGNNSISKAILQKLIQQCPNIVGLIDNTTDAARMLMLSKDRDYHLLTDCDAVFEIAVLLGYDGLIR